MAPQGEEADNGAAKEEGPYNRSVVFYINGEKCVVTAAVDPNAVLVDYLRVHRRYTGTKTLCREGGCGACTVVATVPDGAGGTRSFSVHACQVLVYACAGWSIETVEGLGSRYSGYHPLQRSLAAFSGTQCGYCSPGMIMTMYGERKRAGELTSAQVERALDGNICRCTGYRPVLDAFKALAVDAAPGLREKLPDIEDASESRCTRTGGRCQRQGGGDGCRGGAVQHLSTGWTHVGNIPAQWYQPVSLRGLYNILKRPSQGKTLLVGGNTGAGVFKNDGPYSRYVSLDNISALRSISASAAPLEIGARVSLTQCIEVFRDVSSVAEGTGSVPGYRHLAEIADHWQLVANLAVRNVGSWAGNLVLKNHHREFPSDIYVTLAACNATINVADASTGQVTQIPVIDVGTIDLDKKVIVSMVLPPFPDHTYVRTFKISPRAANAHAYVTAALRIPVDVNDDVTVLEKPGLFFGGVGPNFVSATGTADYLTGQKLTSDSVLQEALRRLLAETTADPNPAQGSTEFRKSLVTALFYKTVLWLLQSRAAPSLRSAAAKLQRVSVSTAQQHYDTDPATWPLGQPLPKLEAAVQVSGEAVYADDQQPATGELYGVFVQAEVACAKIDRVDATDALAVPGVITFVTAEDVPGINSFAGVSPRTMDKVFATDRTDYAGQSVGLVVATSRDVAVQAAKLVRVLYSDKKKPVLSIREALQNGRLVTDGHPEREIREGDVEACLTASKHVIKGDIDIGTQFHFTLEPLHARVVPVEDGYDVVCTTQYVTAAQSAVALVLGIPANSINMEVRRLGGAFGCKISRGHLLACAAAVAAKKTKRPVRINLDLVEQMTLVGWREPYYANYEVGFDDAGVLEAVKVQLYSDPGFINSDSSVWIAANAVRNAYSSKSWKVTPADVKTDTAANTWCRTPGHVEGIAVIENILEHVAVYLNKDPLDVREANLAPDLAMDKGGPNVFKNVILPLLKEKGTIELRKGEIAEFNKANRWRKRGLSVQPLRYPFSYPGMCRYGVQVVIYKHDGTVAITHGGIEMGQGINTKAVQVAASILGVPLSIISVKPSSNITGANSFVTGGSYGSDVVCHGIKVCCERLHARIELVKKTLAGKPTWPDLIKTCLHMDVDLSERYWTKTREHPVSYVIWAGACVEVELDVLTGQFLIRRADIIEDAGRSISPDVDVGQVEGAFVMGLGLFTCEELRYDKDTGRKNVTGTWEYKVPTALDIPEDFRVSLLSNAPNPYGVLRSKATGEPPLCLSYCVVTALRQAVAAARRDNGKTDWLPMPTPLTVESLQRLCGVRPEQFSLHASVGGSVTGEG